MPSETISNQDIIAQIATVLQEHSKMITELNKTCYEVSLGIIPQQEQARFRKEIKESMEAIVALAQPPNQWLKEVTE